MKKTISIFLALLMLTSSFNLTFAIHNCEGEFSEFALLFGETEVDCGMEEDVDKCNSHSHSEEEPQEEDECCDDTIVQVTIEDNFNSSVTEFKFNSNSKTQNNFLVAFTATFIAPYLDIFSLGANPKHTYRYYSSPLLRQDFQVLNQIFLI